MIKASLIKRVVINETIPAPFQSCCFEREPFFWWHPKKKRRGGCQIISDSSWRIDATGDVTVEQGALVSVKGAEQSGLGDGYFGGLWQSHASCFIFHFGVHESPQFSSSKYFDSQSLSMKTWLWNFLLFLHEKMPGTISLNSASLTPSPMSQELWPSTEAPWMSMTPPSLPLLHYSWSVQQPQAPKNANSDDSTVIFFYQRGLRDPFKLWRDIYIYTYWNWNLGQFALASGIFCSKRFLEGTR